MAEEISHTGIVKTVGPRETTVEIVSNSACSQCHAASLCSVAESVKKDVKVMTDPSGNYAPGEEVEVVLSQSMGSRAVWISYVIPLVILMILVVSLSYTALPELIVGLVGIGALALYFVAVWLLRDKISRDYVFSIRRKN